MMERIFYFRDFQALIWTRALLSVHRVVKQNERNFGKINDVDATLEIIDGQAGAELGQAQLKLGLVFTLFFL